MPILNIDSHCQMWYYSLKATHNGWWDLKKKAEMKILVEIKSVYGTERIFPADENAKIFTQIIGQKTLSREHIELIKKRGFQVEVKQQKPNL